MKKILLILALTLSVNAMSLDMRMSILKGIATQVQADGNITRCVSNVNELLEAADTNNTITLTPKMACLSMMGMK